MQVANYTSCICLISHNTPIKGLPTPHPPSAGTEGVFGWGLTGIFAPGVGDLTDYHIIHDVA